VSEVRATRAKTLADRRHWFRVQVPAHAAVWHKGKLCGYYVVHDLSMRGCLLGGGEPRRVGEQLELLLHLPRRNSLAVRATVRRVLDGRMGLSFEYTTPRADDCIQELVLEAFATLRAQAQGSVALVVEPSTIARKELVQTLAKCGQLAVGVATPLDAVQLLMEQGERVESAFIEAHSHYLPSLELIEYLSQHHPRVHRILIGSPDTLVAYADAEATGEVHGLLETPCQEAIVARMLSRLRCVPHGAPIS
jgi:hypothetical protein